MSEVPKVQPDKNSIKWAINRLNVDVIPVRARSGAHSTVYELRAADESWFLKIGSSLKPEQERLVWLQDKLTVPKIIDFISDGEQYLLLTTGIKGTDLAHLSTKLPPDEIVSKFASALKSFHATDTSGCPFEAYKEGDVLVHGDACLPNFMFKDDGEFSGYIDLGDMGIGSVDVDLSAAVWSLQFNLGPGYGLNFLEAYGYENANEDEVERLRVMYEHSPIFER